MKEGKAIQRYKIFSSADGWVTENGKLPGFGTAVERHEHFK